MIAPEHLQHINLIYPGATSMSEAGHDYIHVPSLRLPEGCTPSKVEALLWMTGNGNYPTRLFLTQIIPGRGANWTTHTVLGRTWYTWSWKDIPTSLRPIEALAEHLRGLR
jgi:hypothetical protein